MIDLDAILSRAPSPASWDLLRRHVALHRDALTDADVASRIDRTLAGWPDDVREIDAPTDGELDPMLRLARSFVVFERDAHEAIESLIRLDPYHVRGLRIAECEAIAAAVARLDQFPNLGMLELATDTSSEEPRVFTALARASLAALSELRISAVRVPHEIARASWWQHLRALQLGIHAQPAEAFAPLFKPGHAPSLERLVFEAPAASSVSAALARCDELRMLRTLAGIALDRTLIALLGSLDRLRSLDGAFVPETAHALQGRCFPSVDELSVRGHVGDGGMRALCEAFPSLRSLSAHDTKLGAAACASIGESLRDLEQLTLSFNPSIGDEGARALGRALDRVRTLSLHHSGIGAAGIESMAPHLKNAVELNLRGNPIGARGLELLAKTSIPNLERLWLSGCDIDDRGARALAASPNLAKLTFLELDVERLGVETRRSLATSPHASEYVSTHFGRGLPPVPPKSLWDKLRGR